MMNSENYFGQNIKSKLIYVYTILMSLLSIFFIVDPVLAQTDTDDKERQPEKKINIIIEYDDEGNITKYDSSYSWSWSGSISSYDFDSIMDGFDHHLDNFHFYMDESMSHMDEYFINPFSNHYIDSTINKHMYEWESRVNSDEFVEQQEEFLERQEEFLQHFQDYMDEHRKLMEKFFNEPLIDEDTILNRNNVLPQNSKQVKLVKIKSI